MVINIIKGDITLSDCDAIVNAANEKLLAGGGVCGAIFKAAGYSELQSECNMIGGCKTGYAVITNSYNLKAKYVIHAVGPVYKNEDSNKYLAMAYYNSLKVANDNKLSSIAFPSISTGIYGFPVEPAARIAMKAIKDFIDDFKDTSIKRIDFNFIDDVTYEIFNLEYDDQFLDLKNEYISIIDGTKSFDYAARPLFLMYLKGDISRRQLLNRMKYFGIYDGLVELNDNQLTEVIGSFVEQLKHLDVDVDDVCLVTLHNYWKDKTYCNDGFTLEVIPEELNRFYFGKAPLDVSNQGFYVLRDISYISKKAYGLK